MPNYRISIYNLSQFSYLEIASGRNIWPRTDPNQRLYAWCLEIEVEEYFITKCQINGHERQTLYTKVIPKHSILVNTISLYFSCPAKAGRYFPIIYCYILHDYVFSCFCLMSSYTISNIQFSLNCVMVTTPRSHNEAWWHSWTSAYRSIFTVGNGLSPLCAKPLSHYLRVQRLLSSWVPWTNSVVT